MSNHSHPQRPPNHETETAYPLAVRRRRVLRIRRAASPAPAEAKPDTAPAVHHKTLWGADQGRRLDHGPIGLCSRSRLFDRGRHPPHGRKRCCRPSTCSRPGFFRKAITWRLQLLQRLPTPFTNVCRVAVSLLGGQGRGRGRNRSGDVEGEFADADLHQPPPVIGVRR